MRRADPDVVCLGEGRFNRLPRLPVPPARVVDVLSPYVSAARGARIEAVLAARTRRLVVVLDRIHDPHNGGAVLRSCDAFGVQEVLAIEKLEPFAVARRATRGVQKWIEVERFGGPEACLERLRARGLSLYVAHPEGEVPLARLRELQQQGGGVALCFGNEHDGVDPVLERAAAGRFRVPMTGFVESLNVSVAVGVSLHALRGDAPGDLSEEERLELRAFFYRQTVREADAIVLREVRP